MEQHAGNVTMMMATIVSYVVDLTMSMLQYSFYENAAGKLVSQVSLAIHLQSSIFLDLMAGCFLVGRGYECLKRVK